MCKLKHLAVAAAIIGLVTHVQAGYFPGSTDFEDNPLTNTVIWSGIDDITDAIVPDATVPSPRPATYTPSSFSATRANVLSVDNDADSPIVCNINGGAAMPASTIYADALVTGAPLANDASVPEVGPADKLLVYTRVNAAGTDTNLCVLAKPDANSITNESVLTSTHIGKDEWHRVIIEAVNDGTYKVYCDTFDQNAALGTYYPITAGSSMSSVAFAGTGSVDDLILSDLIPELPVHTLTWDTSLASVSYAVGNTTNALTLSDGSFEFQVADGTPVTLIGNTGYYNVTTNATTAAGSVLALNVAAPTGLAKFAPGASGTGTGTANDPYTIPDYATLVAMQVAVANDATFAGAHYLQTDDIALTAPWPGIGIQNGKDLINYTVGNKAGNITQEEADQRDAAWDTGAFKGTYDGGNFTISNFQMVGVAGNPDSTTEGLDYCGFFNSVDGATIKNLKIQYAGSLFAADTTASTKESGATFVGVAKTATLSNLTSLQKDAATGVSCSKGFGGISGYTADGTTIDSCTNNVNMTSLANNKCGGIAMITQKGSAVTIRNCQNNGTQTTGSSNSEYGAIVGYVGLNTTIADCETTVGRFLKHQGSTITLQGVNKGDANVISYHGAATPGLNFAIVDGNVATFVADNALASNNTYKVMASSATATYAFAAPGTISFDTNLVQNVTFAITADPSLVLTDATVAGVTTYTAALAVAQINGGTKYASFKAAVDAAVAGDLVTVLANCSISESVSFTKDITVTNDYTITASCNYALCIGATVAFGGSGKIERASGIEGSAFCVGANETTRGTITAGTAGALTFDGLTLCGGSGGNLIKLENGTVTMNGGVLKDGLRGIKADADAGSYTSAIVINGGTITNCSAYAVYASAESATGTATITINGGVIAGVIGKAGKGGTETITIPGTSTAKFSADQTAFCESGYETVLSDGWYVVQAVAAQGYNDPQGTAIEDPAVIEWLSENGFTQADIDALGNDNAAYEKFYEAYIVNYDFRVQGAGVALSFTDITVTNDISVTVQLVRTAPLGAIHGKLYFYGATDLTAGFGERPIVDTSVSFGDTDETFATQATQGTVTQTATATLTFVSDKFFKAQIHAELPDNGE